MTFVVASEQARVVANELFILVQIAERCTDSLQEPMNDREANPVPVPVCTHLAHVWNRLGWSSVVI